MIYRINGKNYDTRRSARIAGYQHGIVGDLHYLSHTLYITRDDRLWMVCRGGAHTCYGVQSQSGVSGTWAPGSMAHTITVESAIAWCKRLDVSGLKYLKYLKQKQAKGNK